MDGHYDNQEKKIEILTISDAHIMKYITIRDWHSDGQTDIQMDRRTFRRTDGHSDGKTDIQTDKVVYRGGTLLKRAELQEYPQLPPPPPQELAENGQNGQIGHFTDISVIWYFFNWSLGQSKA